MVHQIRLTGTGSNYILEIAWLKVYGVINFSAAYDLRHYQHVDRLLHFSSWFLRAILVQSAVQNDSRSSSVMCRLMARITAFLFWNSLRTSIIVCWLFTSKFHWVFMPLHGNALHAFRSKMKVAVGSDFVPCLPAATISLHFLFCIVLFSHWFLWTTIPFVRQLSSEPTQLSSRHHQLRSMLNN